MDEDDERVSVPTDSLSWEAIGHAGLRDISEIKDYRVRRDGDHTVHTMNFGEGSFFSITYSDQGGVLQVEEEGVRFEWLGESLFVMKAFDLVEASRNPSARYNYDCPEEPHAFRPDKYPATHCAPAPEPAVRV